MRIFDKLLTGALLIALTAVTAAQQAGDTEAPPEAESSPPPTDAESRPRPRSEDDVFVPSEEIAADEEITFPVDI